MGNSLGTLCGNCWRIRSLWKYALCLELEDPGFDATVLCEFRGRQRTDATAVVAAIRLLNRLELVGATLQHALRTQCPAEWAERYGRRLEEYRLPKDLPARQARAAQIGADGLVLATIAIRDLILALATS